MVVVLMYNLSIRGRFMRHGLFLASLIVFSSSAFAGVISTSPRPPQAPFQVGGESNAAITSDEQMVILSRTQCATAITPSPKGFQPVYLGENLSIQLSTHEAFTVEGMQLRVMCDGACSGTPHEVSPLQLSGRNPSSVYRATLQPEEDCGAVQLSFEGRDGVEYCANLSFATVSCPNGIFIGSPSGTGTTNGIQGALPSQSGATATNAAPVAKSCSLQAEARFDQSGWLLLIISFVLMLRLRRNESDKSVI